LHLFEFDTFLKLNVSDKYLSGLFEALK
jgi:hypothetical protein